MLAEIFISRYFGKQTWRDFTVRHYCKARYMLRDVNKDLATKAKDRGRKAKAKDFGPKAKAKY